MFPIFYPMFNGNDFKDMSGWELFNLFIVAIFIVWFGIMLVLWIFPLEGPRTLFQVICENIKYLSSLKLW